MLAALMAGMIPQAASAAAGRIALDVAGTRRTALVVEYERLKRARRATMIVIHGSNSTSGRTRRGMGADDIARATGFTLVFPDALDNKWNRLRGGTAGPDDPAFIRALIAKVIQDGTADRRRIYLMGIASGGMLAMRVGCENSDLLAGLGLEITNMPSELAQTCKPSKPLPTLLINATADRILPYGGGKANLSDDKGDVVSTDATLAPFAAAAGCAGSRNTTALPDRDSHDSSRAFVERSAGCKVPVDLIRLEGAGHIPPALRATPGVPNAGRNSDIDGARTIADFFRRGDL